MTFSIVSMSECEEKIDRGGERENKIVGEREYREKVRERARNREILNGKNIERDRKKELKEKET